MDSTIRIRRGTIADIPSILRQRRGMMAEMGMAGGAGDWEPYAALFSDFARRGISDGSYQQWLAETFAGEVIAGGAVFIIPWIGNPQDHRLQRAFIVNVFTEPGFRRRGIARQLVQTMTDWCREHGFRSVRLVASEMGRPLYASLGFVPTSEMKLALTA